MKGCDFEKVSIDINFDQDDKINGYEDDDWILVYNLPKPVGQFWKKGSDGWVEQGTKIEEQIINWGKLYQTITEQIWGLIDIYYNSRGLKLTRLNPVGVHEPLNFYYIWKVTVDNDPQYDPN